MVQYYKKIVEWEKEPKYEDIFAGIFGFVAIIILAIALLTFNTQSFSEFLIVGISIVMSSLFFMSIVILSYGLGVRKQKRYVKLRC